LRSQKRVLILGAGIAGLSAAWHLRQKGVPCLVFEKEGEVGGLCRSKKIRGFTFDYSGHLLHFKKPYVFRLIQNLLHGRLAKHERSAWVYSQTSYTRYPFQSNLFGLPPEIRRECLSGFVQARKKNRTGTSKDFSDWIYRTFGKGIARHFMIPYNAKFWTLPPEDMTCEWLDGMVPVPSVREVTLGSKRDSKKQIGYNAEFWYPKRGGIDQVPLAFLSGIKDIFTGSRITKIDLEKKEIQIASGGREKFDHLISTIPLPEIVPMVPRLPESIRDAARKLRWNSILNLNLGYQHGKDAPRQHWAYFPGKMTSFFRVGFPHHFSSGIAPERKKALYAEVSYSKTKPIERSAMIARIISDLKNVGIFSDATKICCEDINDIEYGYPIYDHHYRSSRETILGFLNERCVIPCGRYGSWRYMSMEDAILDGKRAAESI